jgi:hypothetical protein
VAALVLLDGDLIAVQGNKVLVAEVLVADQHLMVGVANSAVAVALEEGLDLLGGLLAVGNGGVAMEIGFIKFSRFGNQLYIHDLGFLSLIFISSV